MISFLGGGGEWACAGLWGLFFVFISGLVFLFLYHQETCDMMGERARARSFAKKKKEVGKLEEYI
ncbi:hypothetical protein K440DRAFT_92704 [Wilcoxina mikolae CBS 423.85]|nr:hypothetical protein K440DRAFT_92704 [Wilcoxina mikolae CBS 423.85]